MPRCDERLGEIAETRRRAGLAGPTSKWCRSRGAAEVGEIIDFPRHFPYGALFSTFSLIIACIVKTRDRFMGIGQLLTMPLFFASNAIYPLEMMPSWLRVIAQYNPLTYLVGALRALMVGNGAGTIGIPTDFSLLAVMFVGLVTIAARLFPGIVR